MTKESGTGRAVPTVGGKSKSPDSGSRKDSKKATSAGRAAAVAVASSLSEAAAEIAGRTAVAIDQAGAVSAKAKATALAATSVVAHSLADLNSDGRIDEEDFRIARDAVAKAAGVIGAEAAQLGKVVLRHEMTKDAAAGAAIGAVAAMPLPFVGPGLGAAAGAAMAVTRGVLGRAADETLAGQALSGGIRLAQNLVEKPRRAKARKTPSRKRRVKPPS